MITELKDADRIIDSYHCEKNALIQILLAIQKQYNWLPKHILFWVSERLDVPMSQILNIATFYKAFSLEPRGKHFVRVCLGTACHVREGPKIMERAELALGIKAGETTKDMKFSLESVNCLGCCALGPVMVVDEEYHGNLVPSQVEEILSRYK
ncbi:MAG: NADH-quinone oxidoreductase subunit NuoE [Euryarchaeota archaeon]|nr:NADH-quinone oxidoreductase subunit NuoE [Euryarchaeota archaeon]